MEQRLKYVKKVAKNRLVEELSNSDSPNELSNNNETNQGEMEALINNMKTFVISDTGTSDFEDHLRKSRSYRDKLVLDPLLNLLEYFPYLFTHPRLVIVCLYCIYVDIF